jgi:arsenite methyltransferase
MGTENSEQIKRAVKSLYSRMAEGQASSCCGPSRGEQSSCSCGCSGTETRAQVLYSRDELESIAADIPSLGCGNPIALSELQEGEVVLDLGSGGGLDCFLAARRVGPRGRVIGLDMTPEMVRSARANAEQLLLGNVEFRLGEMEHMPVEDESVDVVISNCVVNLSPNKDGVFKEAYRVLRPGGRLCVSDIVTRGELPEAVRNDLTQWAGCVAGALDEQDYLGRIGAAGFVDLEKQDVALDPNKEEAARAVGAPIASITVKAYKPN